MIGRLIVFAKNKDNLDVNQAMKQVKGLFYKGIQWLWSYVIGSMG